MPILKRHQDTGMHIVRAQTPDHYRAAGGLFKRYAAGLGFDLAFQGFEEELMTLPAMYGPPAGCLLLALAPDTAAAGCVGLRRLDDGVCEMKRLYVSAAFQGRGWGRRLAEAIIGEARVIGYGTMRLDTVSEMTTANALYRSLGFRPIPAYRYNPIETATYYELAL